MPTGCRRATGRRWRDPTACRRISPPSPGRRPVAWPPSRPIPIAWGAPWPSASQSTRRWGSPSSSGTAPGCSGRSHAPPSPSSTPPPRHDRAGGNRAPSPGSRYGVASGGPRRRADGGKWRMPVAGTDSPTGAPPGVDSLARARRGLRRPADRLRAARSASRTPFGSSTDPPPALSVGRSEQATPAEARRHGELHHLHRGRLARPAARHPLGSFGSSNVMPARTGWPS